uniref:Tc1-like transposase DDE domain-containing protein n=1 Tax=Amphilophus citrinellus TaxID=61819 RepID=A0A3Q0SGT9_AMPCI
CTKQQAILLNLGVERIDWPACSPDLNPIKVTNTTTLADLLVEEWDVIPQQCVTKLMTSMRRRCQAVVAILVVVWYIC